MRLRLIVPVAREDAVARFDRESPLVASPGTSIEVVGLESGPSSIETRVDEVAAGPGILRRVREADADGVDGIYICCLADPAVDAARELTTIPVVGAFEAAVLTALLVGRQVTVLTVVESATRLLWDLTRHHALQDRVRAIRAIDVPVEQLHGSSPTVDRLAAAATQAVRSGEADVIVLGCTGMVDQAATLRDRLAATGVDVPIIEPTAAAVHWLEGAARLGLRRHPTDTPAPLRGMTGFGAPSGDAANAPA